MNRDELDLINLGLRIASERPVRRVARISHRESFRSAPPLREVGDALQRACERCGLVPPRTHS